MKTLILLSLMVGIGQAQSDSVTLVAGAPPAVRLDSVSVSATNRQGASQTWYWIVASYTRGKANAVGPTCIDKLATNSVISIGWSGTGATSYDVLRYVGNQLPTSGSLLVGSVAGTSTTDTVGSSLSAYTVQTSPGGAEATIRLDNRNYAVPTLVSTVPIAGGGVSAPITTALIMGDGAGGLAAATGVTASGGIVTATGFGTVSDMLGLSGVCSSAGDVSLPGVNRYSFYIDCTNLVLMYKTNAGTSFSATGLKRIAGYTFDGGSSAISGTQDACIPVPAAATITRVTVIADAAGDGVLDVRTVSFDSYTGPASASSITAAATPTLTADVSYQDSTLIGWNTAVATNSVMCFHLTSPATIKWVAISVEGQ